MGLVLISLLVWIWHINHYVKMLTNHGAEVVTRGYESGLMSWYPHSVRFVEVDLSNTTILESVVLAINKSGATDVQLFKCKIGRSSLPVLKKLKHVKSCDLRLNDLNEENITELVEQSGIEFAYLTDFHHSKVQK